jgi:hypothetical protein
MRIGNELVRLLLDPKGVVAHHIGEGAHEMVANDDG